MIIFVFFFFFQAEDGIRDWSVTGVQTCALPISVPETEDQEKRTKNKDDAEVVDHDLKMAQLWTWDIAAGQEKQIIKGDFTVSDPRWSPDGLHITFYEQPHATAR